MYVASGASLVLPCKPANDIKMLKIRLQEISQLLSRGVCINKEEVSEEQLLVSVVISDAQWHCYHKHGVEEKLSLSCMAHRHGTLAAHAQRPVRRQISRKYEHLFRDATFAQYGHSIVILVHSSNNVMHPQYLTISTFLHCITPVKRSGGIMRIYSRSKQAAES